MALYLLYIESLDGSPEVFFGKIQDFHHGAVLGVGADSVFLARWPKLTFFFYHHYCIKECIITDCIVFIVFTYLSYQ